MADDKSEGTTPKPPASAPATPTGCESGEAPETSPLFRRLAERVGGLLAEGSHVDRGELVVAAKASSVDELCRFLRDDADLDCDYLVQLTAIDFPARAERFTILWTMMSIAKGHRLHVAATVGDGQAVPSVRQIWRTADWHERECFDMFGVPFAGHPDLRRILLPSWWEGFPLRKDYPTEGKGEHELVVEECLRPQA